MPAKIDTSLIPAVIRDAVDPEILKRAQSIEWSINRDSGEDERGYLDANNPPLCDRSSLRRTGLLSSLSNRSNSSGGAKKSVEWLDSRCDSGFEFSPSSPSLAPSGDRLDAVASADSGRMKRHVALNGDRQSPFPMYETNKKQLTDDVVFEVSPKGQPGERTVHYEKASRIVNESELRSLGLDPNYFTPNTICELDEREEETCETEELKGEPNELMKLYEQMQVDTYGLIESDEDNESCSPNQRRARSCSPSSRRRNEESVKKTILFSSVEELNADDRQEFYPYRDASQGKPLPGDNEYGTWGSRFDEKERQWKLSNGQWVRIGEKPKPKPAPEVEKVGAERIKCKIELPREKPKVEVEPQKVEPEVEIDIVLPPEEPVVNVDIDLEPAAPHAPLRKPLADDSWIREPTPSEDSVRATPSPIDLGLDLEPEIRKPARRRPVDLDDEPKPNLDALKDKYRPKPEPKRITKPSYAPPPSPKPETFAKQPSPPGTILLKPPTPPPQEIKLEPAKPIYVEMKKPLKQPEPEEDKVMEDPNLMWMKMGPWQYGPPFGTLGKRKGAEEEWVGPPCELCHKQIEERRCMLAENRKFHCWHFSCSFCLKTLKPADFLIAEADKKPYCLNCHKREFPEISLAHLNLSAEAANKNEQVSKSARPVQAVY